MKKNYVLIILISTILGLFIGIISKDPSYKSNTYISKSSVMKKEVKNISKSIRKSTKLKENLESELNDLKIQNNYEDKIEEIDYIKYMLSYSDIKKDGISIKVDALNDDIGNIASFVDYNKILINLVNEIKVNGGEFISINNQRINQYSEIVLAGSHININAMPVAPPYEFKIIGDTDKLRKYIEKDSQYIKNIKDNYPIKVETKFEKEIPMDKISTPNKLRYIEGK